MKNLICFSAITKKVYLYAKGLFIENYVIKEITVSGLCASVCLLHESF